MFHRTTFSPLRFSLLAAIGAACPACDSEGDAGQLCDDPKPLAQPSGDDSGFGSCPDGSTHRTGQATCGVEIPGEACQGDETNQSCTTDVDCTDRANGRCMHLSFEGPGSGETSCGCLYACATDADCQDGTVCACANITGGYARCISAECKSGDECDSGERGLSTFDDGCGTSYQLACRSNADTCRSNADCAQDEQCGLDYDSSNWACRTAGCAIGRPLLVDGTPRAAPARSRSDWRDAEVRPSTDGLDEATRSALAARWQSIAAMEHASVASFARFTLQLMALGAPADLLADTQRAAADEVEHARVAYAIASTYAGRELGPDVLDIGDCSIESDRHEVLRGLVEEACVGESVGAAEALATAEAAEDPVLHEVLLRVAEDEERHAALAWRTLSWMLQDADEPTWKLTQASFERAIAAMQRPAQDTALAAPAHGLWSADQIASLRRRALDEVVTPCMQALSRAAA